MKLSNGEVISSGGVSGSSGPLFFLTGGAAKLLFESPPLRGVRSFSCLVQYWFSELVKLGHYLRTDEWSFEKEKECQ